MDSKVKLAGHPLHPMLVAFPVTLYTTTLIAFVVHAVTGSALAFRVGLWSNLAGVAMALVAAVPGLIDLVSAIPSGHPAKPLGLAHMTLNLTALGLFIANLVVQRGAWVDMSTSVREMLGVPHLQGPDVMASLLFSGGGFGVTLFAGALGLALVHKHGVGVRDNLPTPTSTPTRRILRPTVPTFDGR